MTIRITRVRYATAVSWPTKAAEKPAIVNFNGGRIFLRDITTSGYGRALGDVSHTPDSAAAYRIRGADKPGSEGPNLAE